MEEYKRRILDEYTDLLVKLTKLRVFLESDSYESLTEESKTLLGHQENIMNEYLGILNARLTK
jgi:hypothetical protein